MKRTAKSSLDDLLEQCDEDLKKAMQDLAADIVPGSLTEKEYRIRGGSYQGLDLARAIVKKAFQQYMKDE